MERSKGLILIVVGLAAILIVWQVGFKSSETPTETNSNANNTPNSRIERIPADGSNPAPSENTRIPRNSDQPDAAARFAERENNNPMGGRTPAGAAVQNIGYKISIPNDINEAELRIIYNEYMQIMRGQGGRTGRTRGGTDRGGMDMGGRTGADMGGRMGGRGGMGMGGFGGMDMGGFGGMDMTNFPQMDMGGFGGMDMGNFPEMDMQGMGMGGFGGGQ
ncbi:MAG: hypothetical protein JW787_09035 [Sedimentisphaerales bacterium]|nr:hypothetical protein [Sedimentisphaerales bacterium]